MSSPPTAAAPQTERSVIAQSVTAASMSLFQSPRRRTVLFCLLLACAVLLSYNPVTHNGFIRFDDDQYILDNPHVRAGLTLPTVKWAFTTYQEANWHPLTWLSHALDCQLFGVKPIGHHYVNVLLHAVNAVLLFLLLQSATGFSWRSLMVAALFALHPINVESVAWAAERKTVLSTLFFMLALSAYGWYARRPDLRRYSAVFFLFALALLGKPQVITFPFLLLLWDYWPLGRSGPAARDSSGEAQSGIVQSPYPQRSPSWLLLEKVPLFLLSAASAVVTMKAQRAGGAVKNLSEYSVLLRLETVVISYVSYIGKLFWPSKLVALYPHSTKPYPAWQVSAAILLLLLVTIWVLRARNQRYLAVGWLWFLGSLVPMIGLVQVGLQAMADRYAYISFVGLFLMLVWLTADWARARRLSAQWLAIPAVSCLLVLGLLTYRQVSYWHDTESFWLRTLALTHDNFVAEDNLGEFLFNQGRMDEAAAHFRAALAIDPESPTANLNLGAYEDRHGNLPAAIDHYQLVIRRAGDMGMRVTAYGSLGFVYRQMGRSSEAKQCFETALQLAPNRVRARIGLGLMAEDEGNVPEAIRQFSIAAAGQPGGVVYLLLAQAFQKGGRGDEANEIYQRLANSPDLPQAEKDMQSLLSAK